MCVRVIDVKRRHRPFALALENVKGTRLFFCILISSFPLPTRCLRVGAIHPKRRRERLRDPQRIVV